MRALDLWYVRLDMDAVAKQWASQASGKQLRQFDRNLDKARAKDSLRAVGRLTEIIDGRRRIISDPPLIVPVEELFADHGAAIDRAVRSAVSAYRRTLPSDRRRLLERYRYAHAARKVVGVGSVGTRAWIVLMLGRDDEDPLFLQLKEAEASVLEPYLGAAEHKHHGQRVVEGQRLMQAASDILLGWISVSGVDGATRDFYIRQLWDGKGSALVETMEPNAMMAYAGVCGWTLARGHARSGDAAGIAGYVGSNDSFDRAMASFAESYADQNERDCAALSRAVQDGTVAAAPGL
jgi:hypothetical protein